MVKKEWVELAEQLAAQSQPESVPLFEPFLELLEQSAPVWPEEQAELLATVTGLWLTGLHAVLLRTGRVDLPDLRAWLDEALDQIEVLLTTHTAAVRFDELLILPPEIEELC